MILGGLGDVRIRERGEWWFSTSSCGGFGPELTVESPVATQFLVFAWLGQQFPGGARPLKAKTQSQKPRANGEEPIAGFFSSAKISGKVFALAFSGWKLTARS